MNIVGLFSSLQTDLRTLSNEARKKHPQLKESAERGLLRLRSVEEQKEKDPNSSDWQKSLEAISRSEDVLRPFLLACETKNTKIIPISVGSIHKLIVHNAVDMTSVPKITNKLSVASETGDESIQLKILQALLAMVTTMGVHGNELRQALRICFRLHHSGTKNGSISVHNTSAAALRQLLTMLCDRAVAEYKQSITTLEQNNTNENSDAIQNTLARPTTPSPQDAKLNLAPSTLDAYLLIQDVCNLTGGDPSVWLELEALSRPFGLELIEGIIHNHSVLFLMIPELAALLKDRICPLVVKAFRVLTDFPCVVRLVRIMHIFIKVYYNKMYSETEVFLNRLVKLIDAGNSVIWHQTLGLEVIKSISESPDILPSLCKLYDLEHDHKSAKIFQNILLCLGQFVDTIFNYDSLMQVKSVSVKSRCIDMLNVQDAPNISGTYLVCTALDCFNAIVSSISSLSDSQKDQRTAAQMANTSWPTLLASFSQLLDRTSDEVVTQDIFRSYQQIIKACCVLQLPIPRDAFLTSLSKVSLPRKGVATDPIVEAERLGQKNISAMRCMFNIADTLGDSLQEGWILILETFQLIDRLLNAAPILQASKSGEFTLTQNSSSGLINNTVGTDRVPLVGSGSNSNLNTNVSNEITIFTTSMDLLVRGSMMISDAALLNVLRALAGLSSASVKDVKSRPLFACSKLVEIARHNVYRISIFWEIIRDHLIEISQQKDSFLRTFAVDSLTEIIQSAFAYKSSSQEPTLELHPGSTPKNAQPSGVASPLRTASPTPQSLPPYASRKMPIELQMQYIDTLDRLTKSSHSDVIEKSLQSLYHIMQASGQALVEAWPLVLSILINTAVNNDKTQIAVSFKSAQLICTDFLSNLSIECLQLYISSIGAYGIQTADLNISFTAINLMMNISDFIAKEFVGRGGKGFAFQLTSKPDLNSLVDSIVSTAMENAIHSQMTSINPSAESFQALHNDNDSLFENSFNQLWVCLFHELKQLSSDKRYEVRNCASQTLFKTLTTHATVLTTETWEACLWKIMFPVLDSVRNNTLNAKDEAVTSVADTQNTASFKLMIHHSRNTLSKQWNETLVITFNGLVRVFKAYFHLIVQLKVFESAWKKLLDEFGKSILASSTEVSTAALTCMVDLVLTHAGTSVFPENAWEILWNFFFDLSCKMADVRETVPLITYKALVTSLDQLLTKLKPLFKLHNLAKLVVSLRPMALYPPDTDPDYAKMQSTVFDILRAMPLDNKTVLFTCNELMVYISYCIGYKYFTFLHHEDRFEQLDDKYLASDLMNNYLGFAENALKVLVEIFTATTPEWRVKVFDGLDKVLGNAILTKATAYESSFWRVGVEALITCSTLGIRDMNDSSTIAMKATMIWAELMDSIQYFLYHDDMFGHSPHHRISPEQRNRDAMIDIQLINFVSQYMLENSRKVPLIQERLVDILCDGCVLATWREPYAEATYRNLFWLCEQGGKPDDTYSCRTKIAKLVFPKVIARCREVLQRLIQDEKTSGNLPVARPRLAEVIIVMRQLLSLQVEAIVDESLDEETSARKQLQRSNSNSNNNVSENQKPKFFQQNPSGGKRRHLLRLFPLLCDCITTKEPELKELLKQVFHLAAQEIGLE